MIAVYGDSHTKTHKYKILSYWLLKHVEHMDTTRL
jgi:hypothetical protein